MAGEALPIVSAGWLAEHLDDPNLVIVDATVHLADTGRDAAAEFVEGHIPGARFFDLAVVADPDNPLPRKAPGPDVFAREVGALGIGPESHVVAYDTPGLYSAARVWWLFRMYGHEKVSVLDGGLVAWKASGGRLESGEPPAPTPCNFPIRAEHDRLARWRDVLQASETGRQILDARTAGRFHATEEDRYPGTRPGHIPGSRNLYWGDLLDKETRTLLPRDEIARRIRDSGIDPAEPVVLTCGSGLTACILGLALFLAGHDDWKIYDGSWDEWGRRSDLPVEPPV